MRQGPRHFLRAINIFSKLLAGEIVSWEKNKGGVQIPHQKAHGIVPYRASFYFLSFVSWKGRGFGEVSNCGIDDIRHIVCANASCSKALNFQHITRPN